MIFGQLTYNPEVLKDKKELKKAIEKEWEFMLMHPSKILKKMGTKVRPPPLSKMQWPDVNHRFYRRSCGYRQDHQSPEAHFLC